MKTTLREKMKKRKLKKCFKESMLLLVIATIIFSTVLISVSKLKEMGEKDETIPNAFQRKTNQLVLSEKHDVQITAGVQRALEENISFSTSKNYDLNVKASNPFVKKSSNSLVYRDTMEIDQLTIDENYTSSPQFYQCDEYGYITASKLNIRKYPDIESDVVGSYYWNDEISYSKTNYENWYAVYLDENVYGYIYSDYVSDSKPDSGTFYSVSGDDATRKSYMDYGAIKSKTSKQMKLQNKYAYTGNYGIRMVNNRYCIAVGQHYTKEVGTYIDVFLENGEVIKCILGECKKWKDTENSNGLIGNDGGAVEFIVDVDSLSKATKKRGSISAADTKFNSKVVGICVYNKNILE